MPEVAESFSTPEIASTIEERVLIGGRFRIEELLGKGAMGAVYRAHDERTDRPVALKRMLTDAEGAPKNAMMLFEREFHFLSELDHPCIVTVFDYGVDEIGAYYTMELLEGADLRERGRLPWKEACALLRDVASALGILHSRRLLHCDLSTRNVRNTSEGRAKLIDFGTMAPMGVPKMIAGTPPFLAPEVLHWQALDGRADLFSLGALAYYMLTGAHAFPARSLGDLPRFWDSGFRSPAERQADVPEALSELVVELLRVDRAARPQNAAAVIERLCAIAGLPRDERSEIREAYLAMPALVGRDAAVGEVRSALETSRRAAIVIEGEPGMGRSRFLDACVLDARVAGAAVLRVSADDGGGADYGVARVVAAQLIRDMPKVALRAAKPWRSLLAHVSDDLAARPASVPPGAPAVPERRHIQAALRDWVLAVARERWIVLAVDDFDAIDEPSAAFLAALPHHEEYREFSLLVTTRPRSASPALRLIQAVARRIEIGPLAPDATEALTRSIFGDVENVALVARSMHDLAGGNPRAIMEIAEHLVEQRIAHFEAGSWVLPRKLDASRVPSIVPLARLDALTPAARELFEVLSQTDAPTIALADYPALLERDVGQTYHALTELVAMGILVPAGDAYRIGHRGLADLVSSQIDPGRKKALNARLSRLKERQGDPFGHAHHLLEAGEVQRAVEVVRAHRKARVFALRPRAAELLERVVEESRALGLPRTETMSLTIALVGVTALLGDHERFARHAPPLLAQLKRDSGLDDWHDLAVEGVPEADRLMRAFERCAARREATPESERGFDGQRAFAMLARVSSSFSGMAMVSMDASIMKGLPSFLPFGVLSPAISVLDESLVAAKDFLTCHGARAREHASSVVARLDEPDRAGLDETASRALRYAMLYMLGAMDAFDGRPNALEHVAEFENTPGYRGNAWRVRRVAHLMQGNFEAAEECHRRAELFELLDGQEQVFPGTVIRIEASAHWMVGDLVGLKEAIERIAEIAALYPTWQSTLDMARSHYLRLQGHADAALEALGPALERSEPGADPDWVWVTAAHVLALTAAGRHEEAARLGREYFATARREGLSPPMRCLVKPLAEALARAGHLDEAQALCDEALAELEADGVRGLWLGSLYEARAFVAIMRGDESAFERDAARCATEYRRGKNSTLVANYERLMREAARRALPVPERLAHAAERGGATTTTHHEQGAVVGSVAMRLAACQNASERAHAVLVTLMEHSGADAGYLYRLHAGQPKRAAAIPSEAPVPEGVDSFVARFVQDQIDDEEETKSLLAGETLVEGGEAPSIATQAGIMYPVLLASFREGEPVLAAIGILRLATGSKPPKLELLDTLARLLVQHGDTDESPAS
jgi:tetratricopeptide (TPR) repeat protein